jgi:hypothetical protein
MTLRSLVTRRTVVTAASVLVLLALGSRLVWAAPGPDRGRLDVPRLEAVFPLIEQLGLRDYRAADDRPLIDYERGRFSATPAADTLDPLDGVFVALDATATLDHQRLRSALEATGTPVAAVSHVEFDPVGHIASATFEMSAGWYADWSYVFHTDGVQPGESDYGALQIPVDERWYYEVDDAN